MKKIIKGKVYDTSTARAVGAWDNGIYGDINAIAETLYQKRTGEYFLHGEGGARTLYASASGDNHWSGGESIIPLTWEAARSWAEEHLSADDYEAVFGEIAENDSKTTVTLSLSAAAVERAKRSATQSCTSLSAYIESLL